VPRTIDPSSYVRREHLEGVSNFLIPLVVISHEPTVAIPVRNGLLWGLMRLLFPTEEARIISRLYFSHLYASFMGGSRRDIFYLQEAVYIREQMALEGIYGGGSG
jgi:hypothetical protein